MEKEEQQRGEKINDNYSRRQNPQHHGKLYVSIPFGFLSCCTLAIYGPM